MGIYVIPPPPMNCDGPDMHLYAHVLTTGGGQKLRTGRVVLPVADNIFKAMDDGRPKK